MKMKVRRCGKCRHFKHEDACGNGWCDKHDMPAHCASGCITIKPRKKKK